MVGARRFPVGPNICFSSVSSSGGSFFILNVTTFFPRATTTVPAALASDSASFFDSFCLLALVISLLSISFSARNSCDFLQDVHPGRW